MTSIYVVRGLAAMLLATTSVFAQGQAAGPRRSERFVDAANGLSLAQAVARAVEREPSLAAARHTVNVARGTRDQASRHPNPIIAFEQREEAGGTDALTTVGFEWPLDLFRARGRTAVAETELAATELTLADRERLLKAEVRERYGDVLDAIRHLTIIDDLITLMTRQHALLASRVQEGASPPLERDLVHVELRRLESEGLLQEGRTQAAVIALARLLGMTPDQPIRVRDTLESLQADAPVASTADAANGGVDARPDVREAQARVSVADARIDRAERNGRVDVSVFASYMRMDAGFPQQGFSATGGIERVHGVFHNIAAGARVTVPILNRNQGDIAAARAERASASSGYEAARLAALAEVAAARALDDHARQAVNVYAEDARTLARRNLDVVSETFELGRLTVFEVLAEQRRYLEVERAYTDALRAAYEARSALERALGGLR